MIHGVADTAAVPYLRRTECVFVESLNAWHEAHADQHYRCVLNVLEGDAPGPRVSHSAFPPVIHVERRRLSRPNSDEALLIRTILDRWYTEALCTALSAIVLGCSYWEEVCRRAKCRRGASPRPLTGSPTAPPSCLLPRGAIREAIRGHTLLSISARSRVGCDLETAVIESGISLRTFRRWPIACLGHGTHARARLGPRVTFGWALSSVGAAFDRTRHAAECPSAPMSRTIGDPVDQGTAKPKSRKTLSSIHRRKNGSSNA